MPVFKLGEIVYGVIQLDRWSWEIKRYVVIREDSEKYFHVTVSDGTSISHVDRSILCNTVLHAFETARKEITDQAGKQLAAIEKAYQAAKSKYSC